MSSFIVSGSNSFISYNSATIISTTYSPFNLESQNEVFLGNLSEKKMDKDFCSLAQGWTVKIDEISTWMLVNGDKLRYQFFGSEDSTDVDVMYFLGKMPSVENCKKIANALKFHLGLKYCDVNLCCVQNGFVTECYKGTIDEVNNMLYDTYHLHTQKYTNHVTRKVPRLINEKAERAIRGILSHLSRTPHRKEIKKALGNLERSLEVLKTINISNVDNLNKNNSNLIEFYKFFATQAGQLIGLYEGVELYTKSDISKKYPLFHKLLYREPFDVTNIDLIKGQLIKWIELADESKEVFIPSEYRDNTNLINPAITSVTHITGTTSPYFNYANNFIIYPKYTSLAGGLSNSDITEITHADIQLIKGLNKLNKERT